MNAPIPIVETLMDAARIFRQNGIWMTLEFTAAMLATSVAYILLYPEQAEYIYRGGEITSLSFYFVNAHSLLASLIYVVVSTGGLLRLWPRITGQTLAAPSRACWVAIIGTAIVTDLIINVAFLLLIIPIFFVSALTSIILPLQVVERRGWTALPLSFRETAPNILPLSGLWAAFLLPWLILLFSIDPDRSNTLGLSLTELWWRETLYDLFSPPFVAFALCLSAAIFLRLRRASPPGKDLEDIFR